MSCLGERIRSSRKAAGLKQRELADRLGVDPLTVSRWERGFTTRMGVQRVQQIAEATDHPVSFFYEETAA